MVDDGCTTEGCTGDPNLYIKIILIGRQKIVGGLPKNDDSYESENQSRLHERAVEYGRGGGTNLVRGADAAGAVNSLLGAQAEANIINATPNNVFFSAVYASTEGIPLQNGNTTILQGISVDNWSGGM
jgi:hypothetical protein